MNGNRPSQDEEQEQERELAEALALASVEPSSDLRNLLDSATAGLRQEASPLVSSGLLRGAELSELRAPSDVLALLTRPLGLTESSPPSAKEAEALRTPPEPPLALASSEPLRPRLGLTKRVPSDKQTLEASLSSPLPPLTWSVVGPGEAVARIAQAIAQRATGTLVFGLAEHLERGGRLESPRHPASQEGERRLAFREGRVVEVLSTFPKETLADFLVFRGELERRAAERLRSRLTSSAHACAEVLLEQGMLSAEERLPVLREHAEWLLGQALQVLEGRSRFEPETPEGHELFEGSSGAALFTEMVRRVIPPELARSRLGGEDVLLAEGPNALLLHEAGLEPEAALACASCLGRPLDEGLASSPPELVCALYALVALGALQTVRRLTPVRRREKRRLAPGDAEQVRARVRARMARVEEGDYFEVLGVARNATAHEVRRAYLELRRTFEPAVLLTPETADLEDEVRTLLEVAEEAFALLRDPRRRVSYLGALEGRAGGAVS